VGRLTEGDGIGSEGVETPESADEGFLPDNVDALWPRVIELTENRSWLSTTVLQRRLRIGYSRAKWMLQRLEELGIVRPADSRRHHAVIRDRSR